MIHKVIGEEQSSAVPGRSVLDNLQLIRDVIEYCRERKITSYLLTLDQSKAFDRVDHNIIYSTLQAFGFSDPFIKWIKLLYRNINSRVYVNNYLTEAFPVTRSVRQGCGLSPSLYILGFEYLCKDKIK